LALREWIHFVALSLKAMISLKEFSDKRIHSHELMMRKYHHQWNWKKKFLNFISIMRYHHILCQIF